MKLTRKLIQQFNNRDTVLVISKYPYKDVAHSYHGVAHYTQRTLRAIAEKSGKRFVVLVENEYGRKPEFDADKRILILPTFDPSLKMFGQLLKQINQFKNIDIIHLHSEFHTSGELFQMSLVIPFLWTLKLMRKTVHYVAHNVVTDLSFLASHLGKKQSAARFRLISKAIPLYYLLLATGLNKLVVLDESVRQRLLPFVPENKLFLSPLWITPVTKRAKNLHRLRNKLGIKPQDKVLICFGFMTKYKGVDWLVEAVHHLNSVQRTRVHLILAGGKAPSQEGKPHYERFYQELEHHAEAHPYIHLTGFVPEEKLPGYFAIADLAILPYRGMLGASASWAEAMKYGKPFILSKDIAAYLASYDIASIQTELKLETATITFARNRTQFAKVVMKSLQKQVLRQTGKLSRGVAIQRTPDKLIDQELPMLYSPAPAGSMELWQWRRKPALAKLWLFNRISTSE